MIRTRTPFTTVAQATQRAEEDAVFTTHLEHLRREVAMLGSGSAR